MNELAFIEMAFAGRGMPSILCDQEGLIGIEVGDVEFYSGIRWQEVTCELMRSHDSVFSVFTTDAFCYYLPGFISAGIREKDADLLIYDSMIRTLDRMPNSDYWDEFFLARWPALSSQELDAVSKWLLWLDRFGYEGRFENTLHRSMATLALLKDQRSSKES